MPETISKKEKVTKIAFHFHPHIIDDSPNAIMKADETGNKRMYITGISSGINVDAHGERMTRSCISDFMRQANDGQLLLYPDQHNFAASNDIGKLVKAHIDDDNNWITKYRLYDKYDLDPELHKGKLAVVDTLWKQINGLPPYDKKLQKGFSVEGFIPENGIEKFSDDGRKAINRVELDGVVLCPRPAYQDSIANAIFKALDILPPWQEEIIQKNIQSKLHEIVQEKEMENQYYKKRWQLEDALQESIEEIMESPMENNQRDKLVILFTEYTNLMIDLILSSSAMFNQDDESVNIQITAAKQEEVDTIYKSIQSKMVDLRHFIKAVDKTAKKTKRRI